MIGDRALLKIYRWKQRIAAGARVQVVQDLSGRVWPVYHTRAVPESGIPGVPIVFFHGYGNDATTWMPLFALLGSNRELVAVDLPGFGRHEAGEDAPFTPGWYADVSSELIRELAVRWGQPPILVGKSMGGMIAGMVAARIPDLCRALVLIDPGGVETPKESPFWAEYRHGRNILLPRDEAEWDTTVRTLYHKHRRIPGFVKRTALQYVAENRSFLKHVFTQLLSEGMDPLGEVLPRIQCPVTVIWGEHDRIVDPSGLQRFRNYISKNETVVIRDCGHSPTSEALLETRNAILGVISRYG